MDLLKKVCMVIGLLLACFGFMPSSVSAQDTEFLTPENRVFLYMDTRQANYKYGKEKVKFVLDSNNVLRLMSRDGKHDYMSFINYDGVKGGAGYAVRKITTTSPSMEFFEINADVGAHAKNCGYWIVGKRDGQWVTYVSLDSLATMGYTPGKWHQIKTNINADGEGDFILISQHEYMPPGAKYGYQRRNAVDLRLQLYWDEDAEWFGMRSL